jgi:hypothetical protein
MRITREMLLKLAQDTITQRVRTHRGVIGAYISGSSLLNDPVLGGTTDVDLFFIHDDEPGIEAEVIRLTEDVHLDIAHHSKRMYRQARELRQHPWLGPTIYHCKILYDPQHFLDFVQASVRGQFERPDHVMERSRPLLDLARQAWFLFTQEMPTNELDVVDRYLQALENVAGAVSLLSGPMPTERRFLLQYTERTAAIHQPELLTGLIGLLIGGATIDAERMDSWLASWRSAFGEVVKLDLSPRFSAPRLAYYAHGLETLIYGEQPPMALWPLLKTWTQLMALLPSEIGMLSPWVQAMTYLGLIGKPFADRLTALDSYLDTVEEIIEKWARQNGA